MSQNKKLGTEVQTEYRKSGNASTPKAKAMIDGRYSTASYVLDTL
jgi:hypothetical protein